MDLRFDRVFSLKLSFFLSYRGKNEWASDLLWSCRKHLLNHLLTFFLIVTDRSLCNVTVCVSVSACVRKYWQRSASSSTVFDAGPFSLIWPFHYLSFSNLRMVFKVTCPLPFKCVIWNEGLVFHCTLIFEIYLH